MCIICLKPSVTKICGECTFIIGSEKRRLRNILKATLPRSEKRFDYVTRRIDNNITRFDTSIDVNRHLSCHERIVSWAVIDEICTGIRKV